MPQLCDEDTLNSLISSMTADPEGQLKRVEMLLEEFPDDARLHFLYGSTLIGGGRLIEGHRSLSRAVEIAPDYPIARFQLGLFQLTSGEAESALGTFGRLDLLPDSHYLRKFVDGLRCLIRDDFPGTIDHLRQGISLNTENEPLNRDMQMVINQCLPLIGQTADGASESSMSEASLLLTQFSNRSKLN